MKEKQYNPGQLNTQAPEKGIASVNTNNFEELESRSGAPRHHMPAEPQNFDREEDARQPQEGAKPLENDNKASE